MCLAVLTVVTLFLTVVSYSPSLSTSSLHQNASATFLQTKLLYRNQVTTEEALLKAWLLSHYGLTTTDRPVVNYEDAVAVHLKFELLRFISIDNLRGTITVLGIVVLQWNNPYMAWRGTNLTRSNITRLSFKSVEIWTPYILHLNNDKDLTVVDKYGRGKGNLVFEVFDTGDFIWPPTGIYESSCDLNFTYFPMDTQTCAFVFESWLADALVNLSSANAVIHDKKTFVSMSQIWEFRSLRAETRRVNYADTPYTQAWIYVSMRRRHAYYTSNILIPCASLSLLQLSTFALPPESTERASFSVTVLVAFGILQTIIKAEIPTTSDTVLLVLYVVGQLSVGTIATFYIVVSVGLATHYSYVHGISPTSAYLEARRRNKASRQIKRYINRHIASSESSLTSEDKVTITPRKRSNQLSGIFKRPTLNPQTVRKVDTIVFFILTTITLLGHITIYILLISAEFDPSITYQD